MKRAGLILLAGCLWAVPAKAEVDVHIGVNIPPPPAVVFEHEPRVVVVPNSKVYYVPDTPDYDMYRYGAYWYVNRGGYWYRSHNYGGPFSVVAYERVPRQIFGVPRHYRRYDARPPHHHRDRHDHGHHERHGGHDHDGGHHHR